MKLLNFKKEFYDFCLQEVQNQITHIQTAIKNQREGSEGKSSAGDKHNTEQAMQHLELEKKQQHLALSFLILFATILAKGLLSIDLIPIIRLF